MTHPMRWLALAALDQPMLPDVDELTQYVEQHFKDAPPLNASKTSDGLITCTLGDYTAGVTLVPRSIPWSQLEGPCATAWYWPDAAQSLRDHAAHLMITLVDEGGPAVEKSMRLTELAAASASASPAAGVFWGPSCLVHPTGAFLEQAVQMQPADLPLFLWIDFRIEQIEEGAARLYTTGLEALGQTELEVERFEGQPQQLLEFAYNVAHYQITESKSIEEGHTLGLTEEVQVTAHRTKSMLDESIDVIQLEFSHAT